MEICMNKKRVTAVILSAMMCMQIFTGCGAKNNAAAVEGGVGQTATESAQGAAGTVTEENAQTAEENVQGTADQDGTEESMTGNDAAEQADSTEVSVPEDGEYTVEVTLEGGSGKATVDSQAKVTVTDGVAYATITWSSTHYDYMIVNGEKYLNENEGGNSTFTFPIDGIPCEMDVIGDTTAMSTPHEIDYTLTFQFPETAGFKDLDCNGRMELSCADQFEVEQYGAYKLITIVDNGRFLLVPKGVKVPADVPADVTVLEQPLENVYLVSSAVMDLVCQIGAVSDLKYTGVKEKDWYVKEAADAMAAGNLIYAGKYSAPDYELLLSGGCTFAIENTMITHNPEVKEKLEELGIEFEVVEHPPAFTTEQADSYIEGLEGVRTKSMFLTNKKKTQFYLLIMDIIGGLQAYGPMMMLGGGTATMTATLQIYNYAMVDHMMGYASAYAWIVFLLVLLVTFVFFKFGGKKVYYADGD